MPPAPSRTGEVDPLRQNLDRAVLLATGVPPAEAEIILDRLYRSYARWRSTAEDIEMKMRAYRREMARQGQTRNGNPIHVAARSIWHEIEASFPVYPVCVLPEDTELELVTISPRARASSQPALFDGGVLAGPDGTSIELHSYARLGTQLGCLILGSLLHSPYQWIHTLLNMLWPNLPSQIKHCRFKHHRSQGRM